MNATASGGTVDTVVVTGLHRSGTTFLGSILATAERTALLGYEPLNPQWGLRSVQSWYVAVPTRDEAASPEQRWAARDLTRLRRGMPVRWTPSQQPPAARLKATVRSAQRSALFAAARARRRTLVVKDPFLSLSLDFVVDRLTDRPVVLAVRHPAAWCMSLRRVGWHPGTLLDDLAERPETAALARATGLPPRAWREAPILEASAWTWAVLMSAVRRQVALLPSGSVLVVPLESLRDDPLGRGLDLISEVGLTASGRSGPVIRHLTEGTEVVPSTTVQHVLRRDTRSSLEAWREHLDAGQQAMIWDICADVAGPWYDRWGLTAERASLRAPADHGRGRRPR